MNAVPTALSITTCVFAIMLVCSDIYHSNDMLGTACVLVTGWNYMAALKKVYSPMTKFRKIVTNGMQVIFILGLLIGQNLLDMQALEFGMILLVFFLMTMMPLVTDWISELIRWLARHRKKWVRFI